MIWLGDAYHGITQNISYALGSILVLIAFCGAVWVGCTVYERSRSKLWGWVAGVMAYFLLTAAVWPTSRVLRSHGCKGDADFQGCVDGDD